MNRERSPIRFLRLCAISLLLLSVANSAKAGLITQSKDFDNILLDQLETQGVGSTGGVMPTKSTSKSAPQVPFLFFDSSLGTLDEVTISMDVNLTQLRVWANASHYDPGQPRMAYVHATSDLDAFVRIGRGLGNPSTEDVFAELETVKTTNPDTTTTNQVVAGCTDSKGSFQPNPAKCEVTVTASGSTFTPEISYTDISSLDYFSGLGSFQFEVTGENTLNGSCGSSAGTCNAESQGRLSGSIEVTYKYTEHTVPEPAPLLLLSLGIAGIFLRKIGVRSQRPLPTSYSDPIDSARGDTH